MHNGESPTHRERVSRHAHLSAWLHSLGDAELVERLSDCGAGRSGMGGRTTPLQLDEARVFCKLVPLTAVELDAAHHQSTANLFALPPYYQYGIGSTGFGAWRELAAQRMASDWVLTGQHAQFPVLYHWRVLPLPDAWSMDDEAHQYLAHPAGRGCDEAAIRCRLDALRAAKACLVLFIEHVPHRLSSWLGQRLHAGPASTERALQWVQEQATLAINFMRAQGFCHFDAHLDNVLTDGVRLYFADFGLASHPLFDLGVDEKGFLAAHTRYDQARFLRHWCTPCAVRCRARPVGATSWLRPVSTARSCRRLRCTLCANMRRWRNTCRSLRTV